MAFSHPHPLWSIAEVVREVMRQSCYEERTLARCARVSRAFSEPALEVLWQEQTGLEHIFGLCPTSFKEVEVAGDHGMIAAPGTNVTTIVVYNTICDKEWMRLQYYARFVRVFSGDRQRLDGLGANMLLVQLHGQPLFPRLKRLRWRQPCDTVVSSLLGLFLSPMLRTVDLDLTEQGASHLIRRDPTPAEYAYGLALRLIHEHAPKIESIHLWTGVFPCSVDPLREFDNLQVLDLWQVGNPGLVLDLCGSFPLLRKLSMRLGRRATPGPATADPLPELTHPALASLLVSGSPEEALPIISAIHAPNLHSLSLDLDAKEDLWKRCIALVVTRFADNLTKVHISVEGKPEDPDRQYSFHDWFAPLYALRGLRTVRLFSSRAVFAISAKDVDDVATAWPNVEELVLPAPHETPAGSQGLQITALAALAEKCARLATLACPMPDPAPLQDDTVARPPVRANAMREVRLVGGSWPQDVHDKCLKYLLRLFPDACILVFDDDLDDEFPDGFFGDDDGDDDDGEGGDEDEEDEDEDGDEGDDGEDDGGDDSADDSEDGSDVEMD